MECLLTNSLGSEQYCLQNNAEVNILNSDQSLNELSMFEFCANAIFMEKLWCGASVLFCFAL